jgi:hypothetical protein
MNDRIVRFGLAAAAVAAAVGVIVLLGINLLPGSGTGAQPTPSPTLTPTGMPPTSPSETAFPVRNGLLDPGRYTYGPTAGFGVQFTVPAGWTWHGRYLSKGGVGQPDGAAIFFFGGPVQVYADPCHWAGARSTPPTGFSAAHIVAALAAQPSRSATTPTNAPMGVWPGMAVELTVPDGLNLADCDRGQFRSWGPENNARSAQGPGQRDLVWAVDVDGSGVTNAKGRIIATYPGGLIIDAASFPGTPADVISEIDAILGSIYAGHWG